MARRSRRGSHVPLEQEGDQVSLDPSQQAAYQDAVEQARRRRRRKPTAAEFLSGTGAPDGTPGGDAPGTAAARRPPKADKVDPAALQAVHQQVFPVACAFVLTLPPDQQPTPEELEGILLPLERVGLRHAPKPIKSADPDTKDILDALTHLALWGFRAVLQPGLIRVLSALSRRTHQGAARPTPARDLARNAAAAQAAVSTPAPEPAARPWAGSPQGAPRPAGMPNGMKEALDPTKESGQQLRDLHEYLSHAAAAGE